MSTADVHVRLTADTRRFARAIRAAQRAIAKRLAPVRAAQQAHRARTRRMKTTYHRRNR
ncbi:hypothetical protein [Microbispora sp. GKU 823]|uniref:hypothetical protein n=1 Tax=Microbispora sp. GKU 823 TaxID=1652100 RepID=UPI0015C46E90|nr:hypothetical protein [Microbispora sp. GKU 823]